MGCAFPFIFSFPKLGHSLENYIIWVSGCMILGIGDSFVSFSRTIILITIINSLEIKAAIIGSQFGKHKIFKTKKSYEGTFSCFFSLSLTLITFLLLFSGSVSIYPKIDAFHLIKILVIFFGISFLEAVTVQVDNLVLPLICYKLLMVKI